MQHQWTSMMAIMSRFSSEMWTCKNNASLNLMLQFKMRQQLPMTPEMPAVSFKGRSPNFSKPFTILDSKWRPSRPRRIQTTKIPQALSQKDLLDCCPYPALHVNEDFILKIIAVCKGSLMRILSYLSLSARRKAESPTSRHGTYTTNNKGIVEHLDQWNSLTTLINGLRRSWHFGISTKPRRMTSLSMWCNQLLHVRDFNVYWLTLLWNKLPNQIWTLASYPLRPQMQEAPQSNMKHTHFLIGWDATWSSGKLSLRFSVKHESALSAWVPCLLVLSTLKKFPEQFAWPSIFDRSFSTTMRMTSRTSCNDQAPGGTNLPLRKTDKIFPHPQRDVMGQPSYSIRMRRPSTQPCQPSATCRRMCKISTKRGFAMLSAGKVKVPLAMSSHGLLTSTTWPCIIAKHLAKHLVLWDFMTMSNNGKHNFDRFGEISPFQELLFCFMWLIHIPPTWTKHMCWSSKIHWISSPRAWLLDMTVPWTNLAQFFNLPWWHLRFCTMINSSCLLDLGVDVFFQGHRQFVRFIMAIMKSVKEYLSRPEMDMDLLFVSLQGPPSRTRYNRTRLQFCFNSQLLCNHLGLVSA